MNGWDVFSWVMAALLAVGSVAVFVAFLADAREIVHALADEGLGDDDLEDEPPTSP